jgi:hypothetical protein
MRSQLTTLLSAAPGAANNIIRNAAMRKEVYRTLRGRRKREQYAEWPEIPPPPTLPVGAL